MTLTKIIYDNFDFGNQPTPYLSRQENFIKYGENFGSLESYTLNGKLKLVSGFSKDFGVFKVQDIREGVIGTDNANMLLQNTGIVLTQNFKNLQLEQDLIGYGKTTDVLIRSGIKIDSVNFPQSKYNKVLDYNINFTAYPVDYFGDNYGVINPSEKWSFEEGDDGIMSVSHEISARGIETPQQNSYEKTSAFQNAENYVKGRTGSTENFISPHFICKDSNYSLNLDSVQENIDRIGGFYGITESYSSDLHGTSGILRYSADINSSVQSSTSITINGRLEGIRKDPIEIVRNRFTSYDWFSTASEFIKNQFGSANIAYDPIEKNVTEDIFNNNIDFSYKFGDVEDSSKAKVDLKTTVSSGTSVVSVAVAGSISSTADKSIRSGIIQDAFDELKIFEIANGELNYFFDNNAPKGLSPTVVEETFSRDSSKFDIKFSKSFNDKDRPEEESFKEVKTSLNFVPSKTRSAIPDSGGVYDVIDLETKNRASIQIGLTAVPQTGIDNSMEDLVLLLKSRSNTVIGQYARNTSLNLENLVINTGRVESISLDCTYTFESPNDLFKAPDYSIISKLKV